MKKTLSIRAQIFLLLFSFFSFGIFRQINGLEEKKIKKIIFSPWEKEALILGENSVYFTSDFSNFKKIITFVDEEVRNLFFDPIEADKFYLITNKALYRFGKNKEKEKIFFSSDENELYFALKRKNIFYLGTKNGFYFAEEDNLHWRKINILENNSIFYIEPDGEALYLVTKKGVYLFKKEKIDKLFLTYNFQEDEERVGLFAVLIKKDIFDDKILWLATSRGLFFSPDRGKSWNKFFADLIDNIYINDFSQTPLEKNILYLATSKGLFCVDTKRKKVNFLFEGLSTNYINSVSFSYDGLLYVATDSGLFVKELFTQHESNLEKFLEKEVPIEEIQQAALKYNEVHPEKISKWRKNLKIRGFFPSVSLNYDKTIYGTYSGGGQFAVGPRDWGISFSWDIGEILWNSYEDDIDTRSRLNTQLRLDILGEINRVYFELLRLKHELVNLNLTSEEKFQKELRIRELIATLDAYTGNFFSKRTKELNK